MDKFYTVKEFSEVLRIHPNTTRKMIKDKRLHPVNAGSKLRPRYKIHHDDILRLMSEAFEENKEEDENV